MDSQNHLKIARRAVKLTQQEVADALGITPQAVSGWERGGRPDLDKVSDLARMYKKSAEWILDGREVDENASVREDMRSEDVAAEMTNRAPPRTVKLKGYVGASGEAVFYRLADEDLEEVRAPDGASEQTVAVEVRGKSLGPALESWLVYYDDVRSPITSDMLNQLCVVGLADDRLLVKRLERKKGRVVLVSNNGEPDIENAVIEWAAKVTAMMPRS